MASAKESGEPLVGHRVYLDSARQPRTPDGSAGEWAGFFDGGVELEAKNWPPLLWWAVFGPGDLMDARIADTEDAGTDEHAELLSQWGEATYPYLVVDQQTALSRLHVRRPALTSRIGPGFSPVYDAFAALIDTRFGPYVLLRTEGLADDGEGDLRPLFTETLADLTRIDAGHATAEGGPIDKLIADFQRWQHDDPTWLLAGTGDGWPTPALREQVPATPLQRPPHQSAARSNTADWMLGVLAALSGIGTYWLTENIWLAAFAFAVVPGALAVYVIRRGRGARGRAGRGWTPAGSPGVSSGGQDLPRARCDDAVR